MIRAGLELRTNKVPSHPCSSYNNPDSVRASDVVSVVRNFERLVEIACADATSECLRTISGIIIEAESALRTYVPSRGVSNNNSNGYAVASASVGVTVMQRLLHARAAAVACSFVPPRCAHDEKLPLHRESGTHPTVVDESGVPTEFLPLQDAIDFGWNAIIHTIAEGVSMSSSSTSSAMV